MFHEERSVNPHAKMCCSSLLLLWLLSRRVYMGLRCATDAWSLVHKRSERHDLELGNAVVTVGYLRQYTQDVLKKFVLKPKLVVVVVIITSKSTTKVISRRCFGRRLRRRRRCLLRGCRFRCRFWRSRSPTTGRLCNHRDCREDVVDKLFVRDITPVLANGRLDFG